MREVNCLFKSFYSRIRGRELSRVDGSDVELTKCYSLPDTDDSFEMFDKDIKCTPFLTNVYSGYVNDERPWQPYTTDLSHCKKHKH